MIIYVDKNQQKGKHELKHKYFVNHGYELVYLPIPEGDYVLENAKIERVRKNKAERGINVTKNDISGLFDVSVDTKQHIQELIQDVIQGHDRFRDELIRCQDKGVQLYVLVENEDGVKEVRDLFRWDNPRLKYFNRIQYQHRMGRAMDKKLPSRPPTSGKNLAKILLSMEIKYGVKFLFCTPRESGKRVLELLNEQIG